MRIMMMSNTYTPIVGGLERSIASFTSQYRKQGHKVIVAVPEFKNQPKRELGVVRIPAIQNFSGTDFSLNLPIPELIYKTVNKFKPQIIHSHHPFLVGDMALRVAAQQEVPLVFTYHTLYEQYANYPFLESKRFRRFIINLAVGYANLADQVFAPSHSIRDLLRDRGVKAPIEVLPTGIEVNLFKRGAGQKLRSQLGIPKDSFVTGHIGRLSPEKNLEFLMKSIIIFMKKNEQAHFLLVGKGESEEQIKAKFDETGLSKRFHFAGLLQGKKLIDAYHAMDVFAFASQSETQGIVLLEAMAAGIPVVALAAPGVSDILKDFKNGRLIHAEQVPLFASVLQWLYDIPEERKIILRHGALETAEEYSMERLAKKALSIYQHVSRRKAYSLDSVPSFWEKAMHRVGIEWDIFKNTVQAAGKALVETKEEIEEDEKLVEQMKIKARLAA